MSPREALHLARKLGWIVTYKQNKVVYVSPTATYTSSIPGRRGKVPLALAKALLGE